MKAHLINFVLLLTLLLFSVIVSAQAVNINTATAEEIADAMSGVGMVKAQAIVKERDTNGKFKTLDGVVRVKGIGQATIEKNRNGIMVE